MVTQPTTAPPVRVEIYDQVYNLRGVDAEYILKLAEFVDGKMRTVGEQTSTIDSLRLAVLAALNIADEYHILKKKYDLLAGEFNRRAGQLAGALDEVLQDERRAGYRSDMIGRVEQWPANERIGPLSLHRARQARSTLQRCPFRRASIRPCGHRSYRRPSDRI